MTQTPAPRPRQRNGTASDEESGDIDSVLSVLEDENCRAILEATSTDTLSAQEIADRCDIALSTTYRKLEELNEAGFLKEQLRLSTTGKHTSEYTVQVEDITVSIDSDSGVQVSFGNLVAEGSSSLTAGAD
jgi:DNA-binding transcriptional ArsR family regulator